MTSNHIFLRAFALWTTICLSTHAAWFKETPEPETILELPADPGAATNDWRLGTNLKVVRDEILGRDVIEHDGRPFSWIRSRAPVNEPCEVSALVRITSQSGAHYASLSLGATGADASPDADYSLMATVARQWSDKTLRVHATFGSDTSAGYLNKTEVMNDQLTRIRLPGGGVYFRERFAKISPLWDEGFREELEAAMLKIPAITNTWFHLRIVYRPESVQLYKNGFLIAERQPGGRVSGDVYLKMTDQVRVAALTVKRLPASSGEYTPVRIEDQCNKAGVDAKSGLGIQSNSLPAAGSQVRVQGVPFVFPERHGGTDHVDLGESLFHYRTSNGHFDGNEIWPGPQDLDPARITFAVPNRPWTRVWLIAASDGEEHSVPIVTARFYRPRAGFPVDARAEVPTYTARSGTEGATRLPVRMADGKSGNLWLVPIDLDTARITSEFREETFLSLELTKQVLGYRTYPDPANYGWLQGGLPSGVRVFAMTLEEAPIRLISTGNRWGNAYVQPEEPVWKVSVENLRDRKLDARVRVIVTDPAGKESACEQTVSVEPLTVAQVQLPIDTELYGLHKVRTEVHAEGYKFDPRLFAQEGTLIQLPPDTRKASAANSRWGLWNWVGAHGTNPNPEENLYINRAAGARYGGSRDVKQRREWGVVNGPQHVMYGPAKWSLEDPHDPAEFAKFSVETGTNVAARLERDPDTPSYSIFTETAISPRLTYGVPDEYTGNGETVMDAEEQKRYRGFMLTLKSATEGMRQHAPKAKIALGWCEPYFAVPFLKDKFPKEMFDWIGVDSPQFERMPEMPIREVAPNRMWLLKEAMKQYGYEKVPVIHTESYYPSSHELALGYRGSADSYVRTAVLSLALGTTVFANCWTVQDCANYWGSQHYGCIGILGRQPAANPKPAFAAFATMTRLLDVVQFDGFVPTGSHTSYCVRFAAHGKKIYCLWTVRGTRPATVTFAQAGEILQVDENGNETKPALTDLTTTVTLSPTPFWITTEAKAEIKTVTLGSPRYTEAPGQFTKRLDPLDKPWKYDPAEYESYAKNHWGAPRYAGPTKQEIVDSPERKAKVWQVTLDKPDKERPLVAWYGVFRPEQPVTIPGKARALGVWANGRSDWGRVVYEIEDAKGEIWQSVGAKDDWNCDDVHSWSYFNFDGWRYIEFPLPNHQPGDNYREMDTVWWKYSAEGVVDLPVKLTRLIVEHRTHNIYVDQLVEVPDRSVQLSNLIAVYDDAESMTDAPVKLQQAAAKIIQAPKIDVTALPNPILDLSQTGTGVATKITKVAPPDHGYDGTRVEVTIQPVDGAKEYLVYVSAHANGAGAQQMAKSDKPQVLVTRLRAEFPLYLFVTYIDKDGKESKPTDAKRVLLKDDFPMK